MAMMSAHDSPSYRDDDYQSPLTHMAVPFVVEDCLAEPFSSFIVIRLFFDAIVQDVVHVDLSQVLEEWLQINRMAAEKIGLEEPDGESVQVGDQTVEFQIYGATGDPDSVLPDLLLRLADFSRSRQRILRVEMD
jgi:hypothetical protein